MKLLQYLDCPDAVFAEKEHPLWSLARRVIADPADPGNLDGLDQWPMSAEDPSLEPVRGFAHSPGEGGELESLGASWELIAAGAVLRAVVEHKRSNGGTEPMTPLLDAALDGFERARLARGLAWLEPRREAGQGLTKSDLEACFEDADIDRAQGAAVSPGWEGVRDAVDGRAREPAPLAKRPTHAERGLYAADLSDYLRRYLEFETKQKDSVSPATLLRLRAAIEWIFRDRFERSVLERPLLPEKRHRVRLPVLFATEGGYGATGWLVVEGWTSAGGATHAPVLADHPVAFGVRTLAPDFAASLRTAWNVALGKAREGLRGTDALWWIEGIDGTAVLQGDSAGAAFATAFVFLGRREIPDPEIAVTAAIGPGGEVGSVESVPEKLRSALLEPFRIRKFLVASGEVYGGQTRGLEAELTKRAGAPVSIVELNTFDAVLERFHTEFQGLSRMLEILGDEAAGLRAHFECEPTQDGAALRAFCRERIYFEGDPEDEDAMVRGEEQPGSGDDERPRPQRLGSWWREDRRDLVVKSFAGAGKTTGLWMLVTDHARELRLRLLDASMRRSSPDCRFPLVFPLRRVTKGVLEGDRPLRLLALDHVREICLERARDADDRALLQAAFEWLERRAGDERQGFDLYLDALDELPYPDAGRAWLGQQRGDSPDARILVTTRFPGRGWRAFLREDSTRLLGLRPFSVHDVREFAGAYFRYRGQPGRARTVLREIHRYPGPRQLAREPLLLALLCSVQADGIGEMPSTRRAIVDEAVRRLFGRAHDRRAKNKPLGAVDLEHLERRGTLKLALLAEVAAENFGAEAGDIEEDAVLRAAEEKREAFAATDGLPGTYVRAETQGPSLPEVGHRAPYLVEELMTDGVLVRYGDNRVGFTVQTFRERFFAEKVVGRLRAREPQEVQAAAGSLGDLTGDPTASGDPLTLEGWANVWPFVAEGLDPARRAALLEAAIARVESAADDAQRDRALRLAVAVGAACGQDAACREHATAPLARLVEMLREGLDADRIHLLAALGTREALDVVEEALRGEFAGGNPYHETRYAAIDALESVARAEPLAERARDPEEAYDIREQAAYALRWITDDAIRRELAEDIAGPESFLYLRRALGRTDRRPAVSPLEEERQAREALDRLVESGEYRWAPPTEPPNPANLPQVEHVRTGLVFVLVPGGDFIMGSPRTERERRDDEEPHPVRVPPFLLARYAVSQAAWIRGLESAGSSPPAAPERQRPWEGYESGDDHPVVGVDWEDARRFSALFGWVLPTEAQWEYACRAGTETPFGLGDGETVTTDQVNYDGHFPYGGAPKGEDRQATVPVGALAANRWGFYQMHGNVFEWCHDVYDAAFYERSEASVPDPLCYAGSPTRVLRGGCWYNYARYCRSASRYGGGPSVRFDIVGFRPARPLR